MSGLRVWGKTEGPGPEPCDPVVRLKKAVWHAGIRIACSTPGPPTIPVNLFILHAPRSVNTPTKLQGVGAGKAATFGFWEAAARLIATSCQGCASKIVVEKSPVPVKTAQAMSRVGRLGLGPHTWARQGS